LNPGQITGFHQMQLRQCLCQSRITYSSCPSSPPGPPTKQCHVLVVQPYILILFSLFHQSIQFFSTNCCLFYIMDPLRTELKQCSKKSCRNSIPPPSNPGTKDYSTCISCHVHDAASKDRNKRKRNASHAAGPLLQCQPTAGEPPDASILTAVNKDVSMIYIM
jgi:hypothetical protein